MKTSSRTLVCARFGYISEQISRLGVAHSDDKASLLARRHRDSTHTWPLPPSVSLPCLDSKRRCGVGYKRRPALRIAALSNVEQPSLRFPIVVVLCTCVHTYIYICILVLSVRVTFVIALASETRCRAGGLDCAEYQPDATYLPLCFFFLCFSSYAISAVSLSPIVLRARGSFLGLCCLSSPPSRACVCVPSHSELPLLPLSLPGGRVLSESWVSCMTAQFISQDHIQALLLLHSLDSHGEISATRESLCTLSPPAHTHAYTSLAPFFITCFTFFLAHVS